MAALAAAWWSSRLWTRWRPDAAFWGSTVALVVVAVIGVLVSIELGETSDVASITLSSAVRDVR